MENIIYKIKIVQNNDQELFTTLLAIGVVFGIIFLSWMYHHFPDFCRAHLDYAKLRRKFNSKCMICVHFFSCDISQISRLDEGFVIIVDEGLVFTNGDHGSPTVILVPWNKMSSYSQHISETSDFSKIRKFNKWIECRIFLSPPDFTEKEYIHFISYTDSYSRKFNRIAFRKKYFYKALSEKLPEKNINIRI